MSKTEKSVGTAVFEGGLPLKLDVTVWPIEPKKNLIAYGSLKFSDVFVLDGIKILQSEKGIFIGMPNKPDGKGGYRDIAKPITAAFRNQLTEVVVEAYNKAMEKAPMKQQLENGAKQANEHNAALPSKEKDGKSTEVDI